MVGVSDNMFTEMYWGGELGPLLGSDRQWECQTASSPQLAFQDSLEYRGQSLHSLNLSLPLNVIWCKHTSHITKKRILQNFTFLHIHELPHKISLTPACSCHSVQLTKFTIWFCDLHNQCNTNWSDHLQLKEPDFQLQEQPQPSLNVGSAPAAGNTYVFQTQAVSGLEFRG